MVVIVFLPLAGSAVKNFPLVVVLKIEESDLGKCSLPQSGCMPQPRVAAQPRTLGFRHKKHLRRRRYTRQSAGRMCNAFGVASDLRPLPRVRGYAAILGCGM